MSSDSEEYEDEREIHDNEEFEDLHAHASSLNRPSLQEDNNEPNVGDNDNIVNVEVEEEIHFEPRQLPPPAVAPPPEVNAEQQIIHAEPNPYAYANHARLVVRQIVDELWPLPARYDENDDEDIQNGYFDEENGDGNNESDENNPALEESQDNPLPEFDNELPSRHAYLGEGMEELQGRVVFLDNGSTPEIPLIVMGIQLVPGQTLPLTIFHAVFQNAIRRCVANDRVFGLVHTEMDVIPGGSMIYKGALGTIAEIYEFQEETDAPPNGAPGGMNMFALKAKGRQRFNVVSFRRQADGNLLGVVKIRPEIRLPPLVQGIICELTHRYRFPIKRHNEEEFPLSSSSTKMKKRRLQYSLPSSSVNNSMDIEDDDPDLIDLQKQIKEQRKVTKYYSAFTPFPYFVYEQFEEQVLVERVHRKLKIELKGVTESGSIIPKDANDLSYWVAQHLAINDHHRIKILKMDSPVQRLRYELDLLAKACKVITCRSCLTTVAESENIFSMSIEGPQGTFVNPHGFVHETLTLHSVKEVLNRGFPSTEASWFPGYAWTIIECRRCSTHLGWKFTAVERLKPSKFWGLSRKQVNFKYDFASNSDNQGQDQMNNQERTTPTNTPSASDFAQIAI